MESPTPLELVYHTGMVNLKRALNLTAFGILLALASLLWSQTRLAPEQISGAATVTVMVCSPSTPPQNDCSGVLFVDLRLRDGSHMTAIGGPAPAGFVPDARFVTVFPAPAGQ